MKTVSSSSRLRPAYRFAAIVASSAIGLIFASNPGLFALDTWDGGGDPDFNWTTDTNWVDDTEPVPSSTEALTFAGSIGLSNNNDFAANSQFNTITFDATAGSFILNGNAINLGDGVAGTKITNSSANLQTINLNLALLQTTTVATGAAGVQLGGNISGAAFGVTLANTGGPLILSGSNSYSGTTLVNTGAGDATLRLVANGSNTVAGVSSAFSPDSSLSVTPSSTTSNPIIDFRADASTTFGPTSGNGKTLLFTGQTSTARSMTINVDKATVGGAANQLITWSGGIVFSNGNGAGSSTLNVTGSNGYSLSLGDVGGGTSNPITFNTVGTDLTLGTIRSGSNSVVNGFNIGATNNQNTTYNFTGNGVTTIQGQNVFTTSRSQTLNIGTTGVPLTGNGAVSLTGSATGGNGFIYNLNSGKLNLNNSSALGTSGSSVPRTLNINGGTLDNTTGGAIIVQNGTAASTTSNAFVTNINGNFSTGSADPLSSALTLNVGSGSGQGTMRGYITLGATAGARTITTVGAAPLSLNGGIVNGGGNTPSDSSLTKEGAGTLVLGSTNFYTGGTTVSNGTLLVNGDAVAAQSAVTGTTSTTTTNAANFNITGMSSAVVANLRVGQAISGTNIPAGTIITGKLSTTSIGISQGATGAGGVSDLSFTAGGATGTGAVGVDGVGILGGSGTVIGAVTVGTGATLQGGDGVSTTATLKATIGGVTLGDGSRIALTLGTGGPADHSSIDFTGGAVTFDTNQAFRFNTLADGSYTFDNILVGVGADPGTSLWDATTLNPNISAATFTYDAGTIDLNITYVPEPTTGVLLLSGLGLLIGLQRSRRSLRA